MARLKYYNENTKKWEYADSPLSAKVPSDENLATDFIVDEDGCITTTTGGFDVDEDGNILL
jgi:hypothetical protein